MTDVNRVVLTGRLTRDPELKALPDGTAVLALRLAFSTRKRDAQGQWGDVSNFIDVSMFGTRAESLSRILEKGRLVGVDGKLRWREWETDGAKRSAIDITADTIELLGSRGDGGGSGGSYAAPSESPALADEEVPF